MRPLKFRKLSTPLLIIGDNPAFLGGLSRIGRDIATLACTMPEFRIGYLGRGCGNTRRFPFVTYNFPEGDNWGENRIEGVWKDFSNGVDGVILTTDDLSRRGWFANPPMYGTLANFLGEGRSFQKWAYTPLDSCGPNGSTLGVETRMTAMGYDRILTPSEWGRDVLIRSGRPDADWLPHGLFMDVFAIDPKPHEKIGWNPDDVHVGFVASNQARKDFPVAFETAAHLKEKYGNRFHLWVHTDTPVRYWNIYALAADYGVNSCLILTTDMNDAELALRYAACDCTILPSAGEGFGYTIAESLACGTACVVTDYAAGQEIVEESCRVKPVTFRVDTIYNVQRAVLSGWGFAAAAYGQIEEKRKDREYRSEQLRESVAHLRWERLKYPWMKWLRQGLK
jgi:glycosyltransferase involved in cell wall biosynthesis